MLDTRRVFSLRLRRARKAAGMTQRETAEALKMSVRHYRDLETGHGLSSVVGLMSISDLFDLSIDYLLGMTNQM